MNFLGEIDLMPIKNIILTFDDGYVDNYELAFPILKEFGLRLQYFLMAESTYNEWDVKDSNEIIFPLISKENDKGNAGL